MGRGEHFGRVVRVGRRWTFRRGRFPGFWVARCRCGWRGEGSSSRLVALIEAAWHVQDVNASGS